MKTVLKALALGAAIAATAPASAALITSVEIKNINGFAGQGYLQIAELQLFSGGVNVAQSGTATATSVYADFAGAVASKANDGSTNGVYPAIYHGNAADGSDIFTLTLNALTDVGGISIFGRTDCCSYRDIYSYTLFNGTQAVKTGTLNASATSFASAAVPEPATWGLMIIGFGGIGAAMRRRKAQAVRVTYA